MLLLPKLRVLWFFLKTKKMYIHLDIWLSKIYPYIYIYFDTINTLGYSPSHPVSHMPVCTYHILLGVRTTLLEIKNWHQRGPDSSPFSTMQINRCRWVRLSFLAPPTTPGYWGDNGRRKEHYLHYPEQR